MIRFVGRVGHHPHVIAARVFPDFIPLPPVPFSHTAQATANDDGCHKTHHGFLRPLIVEGLRPGYTRWPRKETSGISTLEDFPHSRPSRGGRYISHYFEAEGKCQNFASPSRPPDASVLPSGE